MMKTPFSIDMLSAGKGRLAAMGKLALVALPLLMSAGATPHPSAAEAMAPVAPQRHDATTASVDPPWTWAERYYFTS